MKPADTPVGIRLDRRGGSGIIRTALACSRSTGAALRTGVTEKEPTNIAAPTTIPRALHNISRAEISENALRVLYRLKKAGFESYLVGGGVRDLLLGREPKDFDVVTDARPEQVKELFRQCRLIGRRFRLAHVRFGREVIEVATLRGTRGDLVDGDRVMMNGRIVRDNVYGNTLEEDAWRRDFTVNALYYNIRDFSVLDMTGGMADLETGTLRIIGDPETRYREDAVRTLRAIRFAAKLGFRFHPDTEAPLEELGGLLDEVPPARLFDEVLKLFQGGTALASFELLRQYGLFARLFPDTEAALAEEEEGFPRMLLCQALANTDTRIADGRPVTPGFLFASLLWEPVSRLATQYQAGGMQQIQAIELAARNVLVRQAARVALPRRFSYMAKDIWALQPRLERRRGNHPRRLIQNPRFRAAYDFLCLRAEAGDAAVRELAQWWTDFQAAGEGAQRPAAQAPSRPAASPRRRRRKPAA